MLCAPEVAAGCRSEPVRLLGATQSVIGGYHDMFLSTPELPPRPPPGAFPEFLGRLGLTIGDVDLLATYDACSAHVVFDVESAGLCAPGEGVDWVQQPAVPVNTSGGMLAEVYLQGMNNLVELVRRLRAPLPPNGAGAGLALATGQAASSAALLAARRCVVIHPSPSPATAPFWAATREHRLVLPRCPECRRWLHPQAAGCPCGHPEPEWEAASGRARLVGFTVVRRAAHPALAGDLPYTILLVALAEGPQLVSGLAGEGHALRVGDRLEVRFDDVDDELTLPRFEPVA